jgi:hypothetical protein
LGYRTHFNQSRANLLFSTTNSQENVPFTAANLTALRWFLNELGCIPYCCPRGNFSNLDTLDRYKNDPFLHLAEGFPKKEIGIKIASYATTYARPNCSRNNQTAQSFWKKIAQSLCGLLK